MAFLCENPPEFSGGKKPLEFSQTEMAAPLTGVLGKNRRWDSEIYQIKHTQQVVVMVAVVCMRVCVCV